MAENSLQNDITSFFGRLRGEKKIKTTDDGALQILQSPETPKERAAKTKIQSLVNYVRNKNWNRRHIEFFDEYRRMAQTYPIIKAGIDILQEETTCINKDGNIISITCENLKVKEELEQLFFKNININTKAGLIVREMVKFGNVYSYLATRNKDGVTDLHFLPPESIIREQMYDPENLDLYRFSWMGTGGGNWFEPWELVHWRNVEDIESEPYGVSALRSILDTWRRIILMRESLVIYRITRAPSKLLFKVGTDGMTGDEALAYAKELKKSLKRKELTDPKTGEIDFKYAFNDVQTDYFVPTTQESPSDVSVLEGAGNLDAIEDYKIIKDDLFAGLKIPKAYLTFDETLNAKATLSNQDIRFAKTIQRFQQQLIEGLVHIATVHLFMKGYSEEDMESFKIEMENPSSLAEESRMNIAQARLDVAKSAWDPNNTGLNLMSYVGVLRDYLNLTPEEIRTVIKQQFTEKKIMWRLQQINETGTYQDPEIDVKLAELKGLTGKEAEDSPTGFDNLSFEGDTTLKEMVKKKLDEELGEMLVKVSGKPSSKNIRIIKESHGPMSDDLEETKRDLGLKQ